MSTSLFGQQRIGYADVDYIMSKMPEVKQVQSQLQTLNTQLTSQIQSTVTTYQQKLAEYQQTAEFMIEAVRADKESELTSIQQSIQLFEKNAQLSMQQKQHELMKPIYDKVGNAIEAVAKRNNFDLILNGKLNGVDIVLYGDESLDASVFVLKQLGITDSN
jgi:outer membrane protein